MAEHGAPWTRDLGDVRLSFDGYWVWVRSMQNPGSPVSGKYLFFSEDSDRLREIALAEIRGHGFHLAKYNLTPVGSNTERVLCLYYEDDSRKSELAGRAREYGVKYRYWKSDVETLRGQYSSEFLGKLSPRDQARFTQAEVERRTPDAVAPRRAKPRKATARKGGRSPKRAKARR